MYRLKLLAVSMILVCNNMWAQETSTSVISETHIAVPPGPNAAALGKFGDIPVSYYTGTPTISIPIHELISSRLSLPISLTYHASGIKADDVASWVGIGWALNAGGVISRSVRGIDDFGTRGFQNGPINLSELNSVSEYQGVLNGATDTQPDLFYYSTPISSGKFVQEAPCTSSNNNCSYFTIPISANRIERIHDAGWKVTSTDGTEYYYGVFDVYGAKDVTETCFESVGSDIISCKTIVSAWHLAKIVSADQSDLILFEYESAQITYEQSGVESKYVLAANSDPFCSVEGPDLNDEVTYSTVSIEEYRLQKITSKNIVVEFVSDDIERKDLQGGHRLSEVLVKTSMGALLKRIDLEHDYFDSQDQGVRGSIYDRFRLKLTKVTQFGNDGVSLPPHVISYNESSSLPPRLTYQQDHWGFFNANSKQTLIPRVMKSSTDTYVIYDSGADREVDEEMVKLGALNRITYPTGGYSTFDFEPHTASKAANQPADRVTLNNVCQISTPLNEQGEETITFTLSKSYTAEIKYACFCTGLVEAAVAGISLQGLMEVEGFLRNEIGGGCGGSNDSKTEVMYVVLKPGTFTASVFNEYINSSMKSSASLSVTLFENTEPTDANPYLVGGLRIKEIRDYPNEAGIPIVRKFSYDYLDDGIQKSSGVLVSEPYYLSDLTLYKTVPNPAGGSFPNQTICNYKTFSAMSKVSLGTTQGAHVGYKEVTVENSANGKSVYSYSTPDQHIDVVSRKFPFPPSDSRDFKRGMLLKEQIFDNQNHLLSEVVNNYNFYSDRRSNSIYGAVISLKASGKTPLFVSDFHNISFVEAANWIFNTQTVETKFSNGQMSTVTSSYYYDNPAHMNISKQLKTTSIGDYRITQTKYAQDYLGNSVIDQMIQKNMIAVPLENFYWKKNGSDSVLLDATKMEYSLVGSEKVLPVRQRKLTTTSSLSSSSITDWVENSSQEIFVIEEYDPSGNIIQYVNKSGLLGSLIWDYKSSLMIAQVKNAPHSAIAFTSFEADGNGNWSISAANREVDGFTGTSSYSLANGSISKSGLDPAQTYHVSLWAKSSGSILVNGVAPQSGETKQGWTYYQMEVLNPNSISITGTKIIDELRLHPKNAEMTTYTHRPGIGLSSITDANNRCSYYIYDNFNRLKSVVDDEGNTIKSHTYQYAGQN